MLRAFLRSFIAFAVISSLVAGQEPPTPTPGAPPVAPTPPRASRLARPAPPALPGVPGVPELPAQEAPAPLGGGKSLLNDAMPLETLLDEAQKATGLDRDTVRPPVEALRASMWCDRCAGTRVLKFSGSQGEAIRIPCPACQGGNEAADARLGAAIEALPAEKRELFVAWAMAKRKAAERGMKWRNELSVTARDRTRAMLDAERELQAAKREFEAAPRLPTEKEWEVLAKARESLGEHERQLAEAMARLGRLRIEDTLDRSLADRYRDLATTVDATQARELAERLRSLGLLGLTETRPESGSGPLEKRLEDLKAQREAMQAGQRKIDAAIEQAMAELLRERAERLRAEAVRKDEEAVRDAQARDRAAAAQTQPPAVPPIPPSQPQPPAATRAQEDEVRQLREELRRLRAEVETLRKKSDPK